MYEIAGAGEKRCEDNLTVDHSRQGFFCNKIFIDSSL